ncbi:MAG: DUF1127 domain-containing protein [Limimaricola sp.]|uniref:DUF1127 domain-containing protein n=1 Tax=Limimaricola sp. TaxID=2211665 RepID=UPI001D41C240|nr:DUF1127 domain-containing protein [Limimaricola sp.]MBI1416053.1 DUF1127 domain-containing protein [Limimaricola sp.]
MTAIDTTRAFAPVAPSRIAGFFRNAMNAVAMWNNARITRKSLSRLSARELDDIGLSYGDIDTVAISTSRS